jgi:transcriptional regulator with XRE-family HTH domain
MNELANNIRRLLGLHAMRATRDSRLINGLSPQALSEIQNDTRTPGFETIRSLARFFEISTDRLVDAPFEELLAGELADRGRYQRVEDRIQALRSTSQGDHVVPGGERK